jgi:hypothetical protein
VKEEPMKKIDLPEPERIVQNVADTMFLPCHGYIVSTWTPEADGRGTPEAVVLRVPVELPGLPEFEVMVRLKSADAVDTLIASLMCHRNAVWGAK